MRQLFEIRTTGSCQRGDQFRMVVNLELRLPQRLQWRHLRSPETVAEKSLSGSRCLVIDLLEAGGDILMSGSSRPSAFP